VQTSAASPPQPAGRRRPAEKGQPLTIAAQTFPGMISSNDFAHRNSCRVTTIELALARSGSESRRHFSCSNRGKARLSWTCHQAPQGVQSAKAVRQDLVAPGNRCPGRASEKVENASSLTYMERRLSVFMEMAQF